MARRLERFGWVLLLVLVVAAFSRTIPFGLSNDDYFLVRPWSTRAVLNTFHGQFDQLDYDQKYFRPLSSLSFATEWHVWGTNRWGYHLTNIAIHSGVVVALWSVLRRLRVAWWAALTGAAYFAVVPSNVAAVVYIAERTDAIVGLCICCILWCVVRFSDSKAIKWLAVASALYVVALLSKEVATATVPFVGVFWLYLGIERHEPRPPTESGFDGVLAHWSKEAQIIGRSVVDRSARWLTVLAPFVVITV
ncbi:MAG: glycosyltransferase family 39 protein, partial [Ilumatobacteraceae bacterium]